MNAELQDRFGPWNPGIQSQVPAELRELATIFRPQNVTSTLSQTTELEQLTGLAAADLVSFRPERLALHELLIRVTANLSVPDGSRIEDLGINFREMTRLLLGRYIEPQMDRIVREFEDTREQLTQSIHTTFTALADGRAATEPARRSLLARLFRPGVPAPGPRATPAARAWGPREIAECERLAAEATHPLQRAGYRSLARTLAALFTTNGRPWGTPELIVSVATNRALNIHGSDVIGRLVGPIVRHGAQLEGYRLLPCQQRPVVINTKGPSASGKSTLRPMQKQLAGALGVRWSDFALISPDIWRKQLLDYGALGSAYKYAGAFTSEELQIIDQKLDRYMAMKHARGDMAHLLIDRFRFDSFAPDSDEAGSNLLTRFGHSVYLFYVITPPEQLVERAWKRGLEVGRYKAVDDTLAHSVEAYTGMPTVFFTWVSRTDKRIQIEFLDNSVPLGELPRTVAFGTNYSFNVLDVTRMLDIERFGRININASSPAGLYPDERQLAAELNCGFLRQCVSVFRQVNFADQKSGRIFLRTECGRPVQVDSEALARASADPAVEAALRLVVPRAFEPGLPGFDRPRYLHETDAVLALSTLGQWGTRGANGR